MAKPLAVVVLVVLSVTLAGTLIAIFAEPGGHAENMLKLTQLLLSWQVVAGGLTVGGASTFGEAIRGVLGRLLQKG
jgi:hypothetical protein